MTLGNMRDLGVQRLIASCLNPACHHTALIEVWSYPADIEIPYFKSRVVCAKCGSRRDKIDVRPNCTFKRTFESAGRLGANSFPLLAIHSISRRAAPQLLTGMGAGGAATGS
jgi:hypothetical protein